MNTTTVLALLAATACAALLAVQADEAAAASGNAIASATGSTGTITARGTPSGCGQAVTSGPNTFAAASSTGPSTINIEWGLPASGSSPISAVPVNACPGTLIKFNWPQAPTDTRSYGVVQIPSASCSAITSPTSRTLQGPARSGSATARVTATGTYYFADPTYCSQGLLLTVVV
eukprot:jgi/Botrbrau1/5104/Bobra.0128s0015.1